ncbi:mersacidin family lantibiotic [Clostridium beijerinckii]|uniref:mersacidin family lantibiotic n=1 Tax=Clostridium beijerinckii TaxID=1520 RepID=UPI00156D7452|nr:mersacidin family lantibiotic [Clostridium beijerinckii]NRT74867.1 type 2 lantibiotic (TIGR03893 family) [Clostridium beijerinckii]
MKNENMSLNPAGPAFEELTLEEMVASQGSGDVKTQTTPGLYVSAVESSAACAEALSAAVSAIASFASKKC